MADSSDSFQLVSVAEACRILNVSDSTLRRLLRAGRLEAQKVERPQGHVWLVKVPASTGTSSEGPPNQLGATDGHPPSTPAPAEAIAAMIQATLTPIIAPLVGELAASRQTIERQAERVAALEREVGELRAENRALEARTAAQSVTPTMGPLSGRLRVLAPWLLGLLAIVAAVGLLVVARW